MDVRINFGKHKGTLVSDLPDSYLAWVSTIRLYGSLRKAVDDELRFRTEGTQQHQQQHTARPGVGGSVTITVGDVSMLRKLIDTGYRALSMKLHPDLTGGSDEQMRALNALAATLRGQLAR